ncbi:MAG: hypothetical protein Q8K64_07615 [Sediminibacterium sp.]|nr:hypothetical protein [Sediminibacterium sp.]
MDLKDQIIEIENELDEQVKALSIWQMPFQSIVSMLLLTIDNIDMKGQKETSMDYTSRLSYIMPLVTSFAAKAPIETTTLALLKGVEVAYIEEIKFLNAYAHFCILMPQVRKGIMEVESINGTEIKFRYPSDEVKYSETIDRLYSYLALQMNVQFPQHKLDFHTAWKVELSPNDINENDMLFIKQVFDHYNQNFILIKPLPEKIFTEMTGLSYNEYHSLSSVVHAFSDFFISLSRAFYIRSKQVYNPKTADELMAKYFQWIVCCFTHKMLGWFAGMSTLSIEKLDNFLSFYMQIYSNTTGIEFKENAYCGEGFYPPFLLFDKNVIFSPHACRYMLTLNNILYSVNKKQKKKFDQIISKYLEPTLISQIVYLFSFLPDMIVAKNVNYEYGEIDLIVLSETENTTICFQIKSTLSPDSARTVERVTDRVLEGMKQIEAFNGLTAEHKQNIINTAFEKKLENTAIINLLVVRSCAGSVESWKQNSQNKILNYPLLASIIADKVKKGNLTLNNFDREVENAQTDLLEKGQSKEVIDKLIIGKYNIEFPNIYSEFRNIISTNAVTYTVLKDFEEAHC